MGVISRKLFPACVNMCVCCPALRSRSRQPVERYKKLLAEIFPKSPVRIHILDGSPNERKIAKLCEYAAKNPFQVYSKLICMCKEQMAYFAVNLLNVSIELLDDSKRDTVQITGCQTLTRFIYSQPKNWINATATYTLKDDETIHVLDENWSDGKRGYMEVQS
ncbi:hypothetical protein L1887_39182 [Cichorium endivia]|nr:hypothetical protein L1887_39182 [Cichorium endivia]